MEQNNVIPFNAMKNLLKFKKFSLIIIYYICKSKLNIDYHHKTLYSILSTTDYMIIFIKKF